MKFFILIFIQILFNLYAQNFSIENNLKYLSDDKLQGRLVGSESELVAAQYIKTVFQTLKLDSISKDGYFQKFECDYLTNPHDSTSNKIKLKSQNVVGYLNNNSNKTIVVGAHYDHIGHNEFSQSKSPELKNEIHNGADDNASGDAGVLELAKILSTNNIKEKTNFIFVCFSGEEIGLIGSKEFVKYLNLNYSLPISFMLNMDMIGRMDEKKNLYIGGIGTSSVFNEILQKNKPSDFKLVLDSSGIGPSDHTSFYLNKIPVLFFFTGFHSDYHKPSDDYEKINFSDLKNIINYIHSILISVSELENIPFFETKNKLETKSSYKVTLGILPNYAQSENGLQIDGVSEGKIAQKIGMQKGDIIIKLADCQINNIYDYMNCLSKFNKGETIKITFKRNEKAIIKKITF